MSWYRCRFRHISLYSSSKIDWDRIFCKFGLAFSFFTSEAATSFFFPEFSSDCISLGWIACKILQMQNIIPGYNFHGSLLPLSQLLFRCCHLKITWKPTQTWANPPGNHLEITWKPTLKILTWSPWSLSRRVTQTTADRIPALWVRVKI